MPLVREGVPIGVMLIRRLEVRPFTDKQIALLKTFADQAVIAIENVRLFKELQTTNATLREALEQQTATSEILRVISSSTTDVQPVFEAIVRSGLELFPGAVVGVCLPEGEHVRLAAAAATSAADAAAWRSSFPVPLTREYMHAVAMLDRRVIDLPDATINADPSLAPGVANFIATGLRGNTIMPMLRGNAAIGTISVVRREPGPLTDKQLALLRTFADQAVIAIENVRLFKELQARTAALTRSVNQLTALGEVGQAISSTLDLETVLKTIVQRAVQLAGLDGGWIYEFDERDERFHLRAAENIAEEILAVSREPLRLGEGAVGRAGATREPVVVEDVLDDSYQSRVRELLIKSGSRALLAVPLLREDLLLGALVVSRNSPGPFALEVIDLLKTFATQSAVAIQNARLFNETKEALERQTATADILKVISASPTAVQPVFEAVAQRAAQLCNAANASVSIAEGTFLRRVSTFGHAPLPLTGRQARRTWINGRAFLEQRTVHVEDALAMLDEYPDTRENQQKLGFRSIVAVPMIRERKAVGTIGVWRREVKPFSKTEIELLETFAAQAVIAIENVRLFNETKEALEQQKASADVLAVISSSIADTTPVFEKILESCQRLFAGHTVGINIVGDDGKVHIGAYKGHGRAELEAYFPVPLSMESASGTAILQRQVVHYPDCDAPGLPKYARRGAHTVGNKSMLHAPMLWEGKGVGVIFVGRPVTGPFSEKEIALLKTFADQAVIAIQNARLFREIAEKGKQLEVASQHKSQFLASMSHELRTPLNAILGFNEMILDDVYGPVSAEVKSALEEMQGSGKHLLRLINNVLDLAKIEAGRMELALADYSVGDTVENVRSTLRPIAAEKRLELVTSLPTDLPVARGDAGRISQCLLNLAGNALKFTKEGKVEIGVTLDNGQLVYRVADTGIGIPADKIDSLFTEFKQTDATIASEYGGTGLGLSITKKFIEMHGGRIWVESEPGKGSTFTFEVPLRA
jgi:GAF domain-containing protein